MKKCDAVRRYRSPLIYTRKYNARNKDTTNRDSRKVRLQGTRSEARNMKKGCGTDINTRCVHLKRLVRARKMTERNRKGRKEIERRREWEEFRRG